MCKAEPTDGRWLPSVLGSYLPTLPYIQSIHPYIHTTQYQNSNSRVRRGNMDLLSAQPMALRGRGALEG